MTAPPAPSYRMSTAPRNLLWIFGDQHRSQALSLHGDPNVSTPHIDTLAHQGLDFPNALMGTPLCCPCRGSILTSHYPHECVPGHEHPLPADCPTVAHAFRDRGYHTAWFGKWHLSGFRESSGRAAFHTVPRGLRGGFDTWIGYENNNSPTDCHVHGHDASGEEIPHHRLPGFETDCLTDLLISHLEKQKNNGQPFFAALSVQPPHDPYAAPSSHAGKQTPANILLRRNVPPVPSVEQRARRDLPGYYGMIENIDYNVGRIRAALHSLGLAENTLILFFSDHGDLHGSHGQFRKTSPLEESIRVPFIIGGGLPYYGRHSGTDPCLINHVDLAPTSLGLCGLDVPSGMRGHDYSGLFLRDRPSPQRPDSAFLQSVIPTGHPDSVDRPWRGIVTDDGWKLICLENQPWMLFNLNEDPYELCNLVFNSRHRIKRRQLGERLQQWIRETGDSFPLPEL